MTAQIPEYAGRVLAALKRRGFQAYLVGGCVRDALSGIPPHDYDIATSALPEEMQECFGEFSVIPTGIRHGTLTVMSDGCPVEVTTFRVDGAYLDCRRPERVSFTGKLSEDLSRRDFTVNAMAYSDDCGLVDPFGGEKDLKSGILRCVGNPKKRFEEDALRILRALRFASEKGFVLEKETKEAVFSCRERLLRIAPERISMELNRILLGENCERVLLEFPEVFGVFIPEILPCIGFLQHSRYHRYDVWKHIVKSVSAAPCSLSVRLSMLLHDLGKPRCFFMDEKGAGHFYGHEELSAEMAGEILKRLRYDRKTVERVCLLIRYHDRRIQDTGKSVRKLLSELHEEAFFQLAEVQIADDSAKAEFCRERISDIKKAKELAKALISKGECFSLKQLAVGGKDLADLGLEGKKIGAELQRLLELVISGEVPNEKTALLKLIKN